MQFNISYIFRAVDQFSPVLAPMSRSLGAFDKQLASVRSSLRETGTSLKRTGRELTYNALPLMLAVRQSGRAFMDLEHQLGTVLRSAGDYSEMFKKRVDANLRAALEDGFGVQEAGSSLAYLSRMLKDTDDAMQGFHASRKLALASGSGLEDSARVLLSASHYFDGSYDELANVLNNARRVGRFDFAELTAHLPKITSISSQLQIPLEQTLGSIGAFSSLGSEGQMKAVEQITSYLVQNRQEKNIEKYGFPHVLQALKSAQAKSLASGKGNLKGLPKEAAKALALLTAEQIAAIENSSARLRVSTLDQDSLHAASELGREFAATMNVVTVTLAGFVKEIKPALSFILASVRYIFSWIGRIPSPLKALIASFAVLAVMVGPLVITLGSVIALLGSAAGGVFKIIALLKLMGNATALKVALLPRLLMIKQTVGGITTAVRILSAATWGLMKSVLVFLATNPVGWIILAVGALIGLAVVLWKKWDSLSVPIKILAGLFLPFITLPVLIIKNWEKVSDFFSRFADKLKGLFGGLKDSFSGLFQMPSIPLPFTAPNPADFIRQQLKERRLQAQESRFSGILHIAGAPAGSKAKGLFKGSGSFRLGFNNMGGLNG